MAARKAKTPRTDPETPANAAATEAATPPARKPPQRKIPASDAVRSEWLRRVEAEYRSAAITHHLCLWLIQIGASPDLVELGLRIVSDELAHARLSHLVHAAARGQGAPTLVRETLGLKRHEREPLEHDIIRTGVEIFCLGETVAVPLFAEIRRPCVVPSARRALDRILRDEVRHRDFGWTLLGWLLEQPYADVLRPIVVAELPAMFQRLRRSYGVSRPNAPRALPEDDRAWGLMPVGLYGDILEKTVIRDYVPRFAKVGIDAQRAWSALPQLAATSGIAGCEGPTGAIRRPPLALRRMPFAALAPEDRRLRPLQPAASRPPQSAPPSDLPNSSCSTSSAIEMSSSPARPAPSAARSANGSSRT